jgi:hypothetical protein
MPSRRGKPNKLCAEAKENIQAVFVRLGGTAEMAVWAKENKTEFYKIYSKLLPLKMVGDGPGGSIPVSIEFSIVDHRPKAEG